MFGGTTQTENYLNLGRKRPAHPAMFEKSAVMAGIHVVDVTVKELIVRSRVKPLLHLTNSFEKIQQLSA